MTLSLLKDEFQTHLLELLAAGTPNYVPQKQKASSLSLPTQENEAFNYVSLRRLYQNRYKITPPSQQKTEFTPFILPECKNNLLLFIDGHYVPAHSTTQQRLIALPLSEALKQYQPLLSKRWNEENQRHNPFHTLNLNLHTEGLFLYLQPNTHLQEPIQILHLLTEKEILALPRVHLFAGAHAQATLAFTTVNLSADKSGTCAFYDLQLEEGAQIQTVQTLQNSATAYWHFESLHSSLKANSRLEVIQAPEASASTRLDSTISLLGENSEAALNGIALIDNHNETHTHVLIEHHAPHCRSFQFFKKALSGYAQSSFEGKIYVHPEAQKTDAYQLNNNLLLSPHTRAHSKPNLDVYADDVKASHGATVGQLNAEQLFYCQTRGLTLDKAKNIILHAFCMDIINKIPISSIRERLSKEAHHFIV